MPPKKRIFYEEPQQPARCEVLGLSGKSRLELAMDLCTIVGAALLLLGALNAPPSEAMLPSFAYTAIATVILAGTVDNLLPVVGWETAGVAVAFAGLMTFGLPAPRLLVVLAAGGAYRRVRQAPREFAARLSHIVIAIAAASRAYVILGGKVSSVRMSNFIPAIGAAAVYCAIRALLECLRENGLQPSACSAPRVHIAWTALQGGLVVSWAAIIHVLMTVWDDSALLLAVSGGFSATALAVDAFYRSRQRAVDKLAATVGQRDPFYPGHSERVRHYAEAIARELGLPEHELVDIRLAAMLCDIGASLVSTDLAHLPRALSEEERNQIAAHVAESVALIGQAPALRHVAAIVRSHHEWYNGLGYPDGLSGARIPLAARIIAVADAFAAMTSFRPYRRMLSPAEALAAIEAKAGSQFCPKAVAGLRAYLRKFGAGQQCPLDRSEVGQSVQALRSYVGRVAAEPVGGAGGEQRDWLFAGLNALNELMALMTSSPDTDHVLDLATKIMGGLTGAWCGIALIGEDGAFERVWGMPGAEHLQRRVLQSELVARATRAKAPVETGTDEILHEAMSEQLRRAGIRRLVTVPLLCRGRTVGAAFIRLTEERPFNEAELNMLMIVASQVALAVENARLHDETAARLREISEVQALNRWIIENTSTGIIAVDGQGRVTLANQPAVRIMARLGFSLPEGTGWSYPEWAEKYGLESRLVQCLREGQGCDLYSAPVTGPNGTAYLHVHITVSRDDEGRVIGATDVFHDVTEHRQLEQRLVEAEKLSALAQLAGGAAHEIRNPLASVRGFVQLLKRRHSGLDDYLEIIINEIDRIDGIIKELLQLAKPMPPALADIALARLLDEVCLLTGAGATLDQIELIKAYPADLPVLKGDANQLKQVFINIITNAIQATPHGGRIIVDAGAGSDSVWVSVCDNGCGIPPDQLSRVFEPFYTTKKNGTGLGLTVCNRVVRAHGGRIDVVSAPGEGTTFTVYLPLTAIADRPF